MLPRNPLYLCGRPHGVEPAEWQLVWQDEFEGPAGQSPDPTRWRFDIGTDWGKALLRCATPK